MSSLADSQETIFKYQRENYFKGTIAVACIYGSIALIMFLLAILTEKGKSVLTEQLMPFTVTFIGGMIVVTALMVLSVFAVKPPPVIQVEYDGIKCPDYWRLEETPKEILDNYSPSDQYMMKYMCVNDQITGDLVNAPVDKYKVNVNNISSSDTTTQNLMTAGKYMYDTFDTTYVPPNGTAQGNGSLFCGAIFPDFFNSMDVTTNPSEPNKMRCQYAKLCNASWSAVCPNQS